MATTLVNPKAMQPQPADRATVKRWLSELIRSTGSSLVHFAARTSLSPEWLAVASDIGHDCCPSYEVLMQVCRALQLRAPENVQSAARRLTLACQVTVTEKPKAKSAPHAKFHHGRFAPTNRVTLNVLPLIDCHSATDEVLELVERAANCLWSTERDRNCEIIKRRFGLSGAEPETLNSIGVAYGLTRERVRQLESRMSFVLERQLSVVETPRLFELVTELRMGGGMALSVFRSNFAKLIGLASLMGLLEVGQRIYGVDLTRDVRVVPIGRDQHVTFVGDDVDGMLLNQIALVSRRQQTYAGAVNVDILRRRLEGQMGQTLSSDRVIAAIETLPDILWLDDARTWFLQSSEPLSTILTTASEIITLARGPVAIATLYAGLAYEARRVAPADIKDSGPPIPPLDVFTKLLTVHRHFRKTYASACTYVGPPLGLPNEDTHRGAIVKRLEAGGGVATYWELAQFAEAEGLSRWALKNVLYTCGWFERVSPGVHAIRGRRVDPQFVLDAQLRASAQLKGRITVREDRNAGRRLIRQARPAGPVWDVDYEVVSAVSRFGVVELPVHAFPPQMSGNYSLPSGHRITVIEKDNAVALMNLGSDLRMALSAVGKRWRLTFDCRGRTVSFSPGRSS